MFDDVSNEELNALLDDNVSIENNVENESSTILDNNEVDIMLTTDLSSERTGALKELTQNLNQSVSKFLQNSLTGNANLFIQKITEVPTSQLNVSSESLIFQASIDGKESYFVYSKDLVKDLVRYLMNSDESIEVINEAHQTAISDFTNYVLDGYKEYFNKAFNREALQTGINKTILSSEDLGGLRETSFVELTWSLDINSVVNKGYFHQFIFAEDFFGILDNIKSNTVAEENDSVQPSSNLGNIMEEKNNELNDSSIALSDNELDTLVDLSGEGKDKLSDSHLNNLDPSEEPLSFENNTESDTSDSITLSGDDLSNLVDKSTSERDSGVEPSTVESTDGFEIPSTDDSLLSDSDDLVIQESSNQLDVDNLKDFGTSDSPVTDTSSDETNDILNTLGGSMEQTGKLESLDVDLSSSALDTLSDDSAGKNESNNLSLDPLESNTSDAQNINLVSPVSFSNLSLPNQNTAEVTSEMLEDYGLLLDVKMKLTVELGRTKRKIKHILQFGEGSIIELDKLAGEPVDLFVNGKKIAQGEVIIIDENFGVRITDILGTEERIAELAPV